MDEARRFTEEEAPHGTALMAGLQTKGRGRYATRAWTASAGKNLTFTLILRYSGFSKIPAAITLRSGLAVAQAVSKLEPALAPELTVKWPNDVMLGHKKCAGIVTESDGKVVLTGIGVNVAEEFNGTALNAASIAGELALLNKNAALAYAEAPHRMPLLLEKILFSLFTVLSHDFDDLWQQELEKMLYLKGMSVNFDSGGAESPRVVTGSLAGIASDGSVLIIPEGKIEACAFAAGELRPRYPTY
jgi:BirA family biotin operon repressor/biotin-[acetyl-CoA-carboxylase] ligase